MKAVFLVLASLSLSAAASEVVGEDWPQWRGSNRDAISAETGLLPSWTGEGPPLAWRIDDLGTGYGAPSIAEGRIFGISVRDDEEVVWALSEADGKELWAVPLNPATIEGMRQGREGPGSAPTVDADRVYVLGAGGSLSCLQVGDGKVLWRRSLVEDFGGILPLWRYNESPLVDGDRVICTPGGPEATIVALDKMTGEKIWSCKVPEAAPSEGESGSSGERGGSGGQGGRGGGGRGSGDREQKGPPSGAGYASAIAIDFAGQRQYVQFMATSLVGVAADTGELLWRYDRAANSNRINCSTPVYHDGLVFAASAYGNGGGAVRLKEGNDGKVEAEEAYFTTNMQNHHGGMIVVDDSLYGAHGGNGGGFLSCLDFRSGEVLWRDREGPKGSLAMADGRLYLRGEEGEVVLIEPNRERFVEHGRFEQPDRTASPAWTYPVIANGRMYIRDQELLLCYDIRDAG